MNVLSHQLVSPHYPIVANHIANDPTPKDQAIYVPSVTPGYAIDAYDQKWRRPLPRGVGPGDLNFLDPNNSLFKISHVMSSAGQALNNTRDCIITQRNRLTSLLIADSGGYQIASGRLHINGNPHRLQILQWMEKHADVAISLDVPTGPVGNPSYAYKTVQACLADTLVHLDFFEKNRSSERLTLLNVLHGNNPAEADAWYSAVKHFDFEGWAFAGRLRHNIYEFCRRILIMARENQIQEKKWIHILGTSELDTAVLATALQRAINRHLNPNLRISFDTSSPFRNLAFNSVYTLPQFERKRMTMPMRQVPDGHQFVGSSLRWPWPSPIGDRMTLGDFCVQKPVTATSYRDTQSERYWAHHNLAALCWGVALANRVFDSESVNHQHTIAHPVGAAVEAIDRVFAFMSLTTLAQYQYTFQALRHGVIPDSGEDQRTFL